MLGDIWLCEARWVVKDVHTTNFFHDPWIYDLSLSKWPIFVSMETRESTRISNLLHIKICGWCDGHMAQPFGPDLASRVFLSQSLLMMFKM